MKYLLGSPKDFWDFVEKIKPEDKIGILTHNDLDGVASAVFLEEILESKNLKVEFVKFVSIDFIELAKAKNFSVDKFFILDINLEQYPEIFEALRKSFDVFLIDHHNINQDIKDKNNILKTDTADCTASIVYNLAKDAVDVSAFGWLVCSAMISDWSFKKKENIDFIKSFYPDYENFGEDEINNLTKVIVSAVIYFRDSLNKVYPFIRNADFEKIKKYAGPILDELDICLKNFKNDAEFFQEQDLYFWKFNPKHKVMSYLSSLISNKYPDSSLVIVSDILGKKGFMKVSARNQNRKVNMVELLKAAVDGLENAVCGGHVPAAGGSFMKKDLEKFKANILKYLMQNKKV